MSSLVFGIDLKIHKIEYLHINTYPQLRFIVGDREPQILIPYTKHASDGDVWEEKRRFKFKYIENAFDVCTSWPITFELISPLQSTACGSCTLEVKPLVCDAIARNGKSPTVVQTITLRDGNRNGVANITFKLNVIYFRICEKKPATQNTEIIDILTDESMNSTIEINSISDS